MCNCGDFKFLGNILDRPVKLPCVKIDTNTTDDQKSTQTKLVFNTTGQVKNQAYTISLNLDFERTMGTSMTFTLLRGANSSVLALQTKAVTLTAEDGAPKTFLVSLKTVLDSSEKVLVLQINNSNPTQYLPRMYKSSFLILTPS
jgi:hypothetical protein